MATFKSKMRHLADDWADQIWTEAQSRKDGIGVGWLLPLAALALTGVRPASLEKGITFDLVQDRNGSDYVRAKSKGAKILKNDDGSALRGQDEVQVCWRLSPPADSPHRPKEFSVILQAIKKSREQKLTIFYDAEAISTRIRELSKQIWPRKKYHVSAICYRELLASVCKEAEMAPEEIAAVLGHVSTESQGRYSSRPRRSRNGEVPPKRLFSHIAATSEIVKHRSPMIRFRNAAANIKRKKLAQPYFI